MLKLRNQLERFAELTGAAIAWLTVLMVLATFIVVVLRYAFDLGWIAMQESITWMHAAVFMLAAAYTLSHDEHVRVDIFYRDARPKRRALVDLLGVIFFLMPVCVIIGCSPDRCIVR